MKRKLAPVLLAVMLLLFSGCSSAPTGTETRFFSQNGQSLAAVFDYSAQTITVGKLGGETVVVNGEAVGGDDIQRDVYTYKYRDGDITITYPNGAKYWESASDTGAVISWDDDYDPKRYVDGTTLAMHLTDAYEGPDNKIQMNGAILLGCPFLVIVGAFLAWDPVTVLEFRYRWWFKNVEPSDWAILSTRISGVILAAMGAVLFLMAVIL